MEKTPALSDSLVLAIDSSTTSTKALVVDSDGQIITQGKAEFDLQQPEPGFYEQHPADWLESTTAAITLACAQLSDRERSSVRALAVTHQRETFALCDKDGSALRPGILWLDERAVEQIEQYGSAHVTDLSGKPAGTAPSIYKLAWLKDHEPDLLASADKVVDVSAYLAFHLTGNWASAFGSADTLSMFDLRDLTWSQELLNIAGVRENQMASLRQPGEVLGYLHDRLAQQWGLDSGLPLIGVCGDGQAAALGANALTPQTVYLNLGTAVVAGMMAADYVPGQAYRTYAAGMPRHFVREVVQHSGAYLTSWYRKEFGDPNLAGAPDPALDEAAASLPVGSEGLITLPYWNAVQSPHWDSIARGAVVGWRGHHTKAHFYRSILEAISLEMRTNLDHLEASTGQKIELIRAVGGGTRSALWCQITADALGVPIELVAQDEVSALGAAVIAHSYLTAADTQVNGVACATAGEIAKVAERMFTPATRYEPDAKSTKRYRRLLEIQSGLYPALQSTFGQLYDWDDAE